MNVKEDLSCGITEPSGLAPNDAFECVMGAPPSSMYDFFAGGTVVLMLLLYVIWVNKARDDFQNKKSDKEDLMNIIIYPPMLITALIAIFVFIRP